MISFPKHKCGLYLTHNEHKDIYQTAEEAIKDGESFGDWENDEHKQRAIDSDEIWTLQWYPDTPIGSYKVSVPTFEELIEFANSNEKVEV